jgi:transposase InsO family protein
VTKFAFIDAHRAEFHVVDLRRVGEVSTSGFYDWQARQAAGPSDAERLEADLLAEIRVIHARSRGAYGGPRVVGVASAGPPGEPQASRAADGETWHPGTLRAASGAHHDPRPARRAGERPRQAVLQAGAAERVLARRYHHPGREGWLYMSSVLDACSRRLLGWSLAGHMRTELVTDALEAAVGQRGGRRHIRGVVFHGDHGSQPSTRLTTTVACAHGSGSPSRWGPSAMRMTTRWPSRSGPA